MKKIKLLLLSLSTPILFVGCAEEKSEITPDTGIKVSLEKSRILNADNSHMLIVVENVSESIDIGNPDNFPRNENETEAEYNDRKKEKINEIFSKALNIEVMPGTFLKNLEDINVKDVNRNNVVILRDKEIYYADNINSDYKPYKIIHDKNTFKSDKVKFFTKKDEKGYRVEILVDAKSAKDANEITLIINNKTYTVRNYEILEPRIYKNQYNELINNDVHLEQVEKRDPANPEIIHTTYEKNLILEPVSDIFYYTYTAPAVSTVAEGGTTSENISINGISEAKVASNSVEKLTNNPIFVLTSAEFDEKGKVVINNSVTGPEKLKFDNYEITKSNNPDVEKEILMYSCLNEPIENVFNYNMTCGIKLIGQSDVDQYFETKIIQDEVANVVSNSRILVKKNKEKKEKVKVAP